ncbi:MAG: SDR family oxidoreductase [Betaproteobacteria bacterium]|nr:SDR family oxidoreductase [Betaproteobacteria bacterium]
MSVRELMSLKGRVALVTGGSRGLGLQIAEALAEMGANLALTARKADELDEAKAHLAASGVEVLTVVNDLARVDTVPAMVDAVMQKFGRIDILVNNAGNTWGAPAEDHPMEAWRKVIDLNLTGTFAVTQEVGRRSMIPNRYGRVVVIASIAGLKGNPPETLKTIAYNTSKGGLVNFTRALAGEWGAYGITVNAVCPGFFPSKMTKGVLAAHGDELLKRIPNRRFGNDEDLKGLCALLASDAARHITGQAIAVDGGVSSV